MQWQAFTIIKQNLKTSYKQLKKLGPVCKKCLSLEKIFRNKTVPSCTFLLELDKSLQIFQKRDIVLLFQSCAVVKKPLAKVVVNSSFSQHVQQHYVQVLLNKEKNITELQLQSFPTYYYFIKSNVLLSNVKKNIY